MSSATHGKLVGALREGMLLLGDRNFATYQFFTDVHGTGCDFLIRAKTGNGAMGLIAHQRLPDGSCLARAKGVTVRVIDARVEITTAAGTRTGTYRLITTILDPDQAPARELVRLYHERWEIETAYSELKSTILGGQVLRGRHPTAVTQEIWALLSAYQVLRIAISDTALAGPSIDPDRLSFTTALRTARDQIIQASGTITETTIDLVGRIGAPFLDDVMPAPAPGNESSNARSPNAAPKAETASIDAPIPRHSARESCPRYLFGGPGDKGCWSPFSA